MSKSVSPTYLIKYSGMFDGSIIYPEYVFIWRITIGMHISIQSACSFNAS